MKLILIIIFLLFIIMGFSCAQLYIDIHNENGESNITLVGLFIGFFLIIISFQIFINLLQIRFHGNFCLAILIGLLYGFIMCFVLSSGIFLQELILYNIPLYDDFTSLQLYNIKSNIYPVNVAIHSITFTIIVINICLFIGLQILT